MTSQLHIVLAYSALALLILTIEIYRKRSSPYDILFVINVSFFIYYAIVPLHVVLGGIEFVRQKWAFQQFGAGDIHEAATIALSYLLILAGYLLTPAIKMKIPVYRINVTVWKTTALLSFIIAIIAIIIYTVFGFKDILTAIFQGILIRSSQIKSSSEWLFIKHFILLFSSSWLIMFGVMYRKYLFDRKIPKTYIMYFVLIAIAMFIGILSVSGRRSFLFPLVVMFFIWGNVSNKWHWRAALIGSATFSAIIVFWAAIMFQIAGIDPSEYLSGVRSLKDFYGLLISPLADPYIHWVGMLKYTPLWLGFVDLFTLPLQLLPYGLVGDLKPESLSKLTTVMLAGFYPVGTGEEPPGFQGYLYMNGGYPGLVVGSLIFGSIARLLHHGFLPRNRDPLAWLIYVWIALGWTYLLRHGLVEFMANERFHWWFAMGLLFISVIFVRGFKRRLRQCAIAEAK